MCAQTTHPHPTLPQTVDGFEVLDHCHRETGAVLEAMAELASRLRPGVPDGAVRALARRVIPHFSVVARQHHQDEELHVFPSLLAGGTPATVRVLLRLQKDHFWIEEDWCELEPQLATLADGRPLLNAEALQDHLAAFVALSHDHIALEESLIYPSARKRLSAGDKLEMGREMAARRRGDSLPADPP
jgi:hemerythrin-like domain-containing protein